MRAAAALVLGLLSACGAAGPSTRTAAPPRAIAAPASPRPAVAIRIAQGDGGAWRIDYELREPTTKVAFVRTSYPNRQAKWRLAPGAAPALERSGDCDLVRAAAPFTKFSLEIAEYHDHPEKDYQVFVPFKDGGSLVYTGQFDVVPLGPTQRCADLGKAADAADPAEIVFVPRAGERVVAPGAVSEGPLTWREVGEGTYAYFGRAKPVESKAMITLVDAGTPAWLRASAERLFPRIVDEYGARTGIALAFRPVVFVAYHDEPGPRSRSFGGGTLPALVEMDVGLGSEFRAENDPVVAERMAYLVAHEAAHLWNGQMFSHEGEGVDWMHEGGADAFAVRLMRDQGTITAPRYREMLSESLSLCGASLGGEPVSASSKPGKFKRHYWCGATIALWTEAALAKDGDTRGLFGFWGDMLRATGARKRYSEDLYFAQLAAAGPVSARAAEKMRHLTRDGVGADAGAWLAAALKDVGLETRSLPIPASALDLARYQKEHEGAKVVYYAL